MRGRCCRTPPEPKVLPTRCRTETLNEGVIQQSERPRVYSRSGSEQTDEVNMGFKTSSKDQFQLSESRVSISQVQGGVEGGQVSDTYQSLR